MRVFSQCICCSAVKDTQSCAFIPRAASCIDSMDIEHQMYMVSTIDGFHDGLPTKAQIMFKATLNDERTLGSKKESSLMLGFSFPNPVYNIRV